jgi:YD repeat-containing protein
VINYYSYHPEKDMVLLNKQDYSLNGAPYETRINYVKYDIRGNILEVQKDKDVTVAYLWSHNGTLPIAQVINAKSDQIFFEGFEADVSIVADPSSAHSGRKFKSTSYTINFSAPPGTYELSYWKYAGSSWTLVKQPYTGSVTLSASRIDDVRVYPVGALMSTYNYDPLLGVLTATDNNNNSTHYTYDELMRLSTINDLELQPLTKFIYQYKN